LLEASGAFGLAFNLLEDGGIGDSIQDRGVACNSNHNTRPLHARACIAFTGRVSDGRGNGNV
jgi:hypothetical protein